MSTYSIFYTLNAKLMALLQRNSLIIIIIRSKTLFRFRDLFFFILEEAMSLLLRKHYFKARNGRPSEIKDEILEKRTLKQVKIIPSLSVRDLTKYIYICICTN